MMRLTHASLETARSLLAEGRRDEAIKAYEAYLREHDDSVEGWLELGLASLLSGDSNRFEEIRTQFAPCLQDPRVRERTSERTRSLWSLYADLRQRWAPLSLALVAVGTLSCTKTDSSDTRPSSPSALVSVAPTPEVSAPPSTSALPEAGLEDTGVADVKEAGKTSTPKPAPVKPDFPRTRYVAVHFDDNR